MAGLNELIKFVNAVTNEERNVPKGLNEIFLKINNSVNQLEQVSNQNGKKIQQNTNLQDNENQQQQQQDQEQEQEQEQVDRSPKNRVRLEENSKCNTVIANNNRLMINEIFKYELDNDRLIEGMIFTEVFGKPLSKRKPRHAHRI